MRKRATNTKMYSLFSSNLLGHTNSNPNFYTFFLRGGEEKRKGVWGSGLRVEEKRGWDKDPCKEYKKEKYCDFDAMW